MADPVSDLRRVRSQGHANTDLSEPISHGEGRDPVNPDGTQRQRRRPVLSADQLLQMVFRTKAKQVEDVPVDLSKGEFRRCLRAFEVWHMSIEEHALGGLSVNFSYNDSFTNPSLPFDRDQPPVIIQLIDECLWNRVGGTRHAASFLCRQNTEKVRLMRVLIYQQVTARLIILTFRPRSLGRRWRS